MTSTVLVSLLAAAIAFLGVCIAWGQWYTARQKLVLDLFQRRFDAYEAFRKALGEARLAFPPTLAQSFDVDRAAHEMRFLFAPATVDAFKEIAEQVHVWRQLEVRHARAIARDLDGVSIDELTMKAVAAVDKLSEKELRLEPLISPYLRMDQKLPRPPSEWLGMCLRTINHRWQNRPDGTG